MEKVPSPCERQAGRPAAGKTDKARWRGHDAGKAETGEARTCPATPAPAPAPAQQSFLGFVLINTSVGPPTKP